MPISEMFEEKYMLQVNKIGLWDVLENCERQGSLDIHIKTKRKMILNLYLDCSNIKTIVFNGKESHKYFCKKFGQIEASPIM
jgi:hypoxanthine-DNA glycosylase